MEALADTGVRPVLALDRARFGGLLISRITLAEGGGRAGLDVLDLVGPLISYRRWRAPLDGNAYVWNYVLTMNICSQSPA